MKERGTVEQGKLAHWLIADYTNFQIGNRVGSTPSETDLFYHKQQLKNIYIKEINYKPNKNIIMEHLIMIDEEEDKDKIKEHFIHAVQEFCFLHRDFSLALNIMSKKGYNKFIRFLFDFMMYNEIPFRKQIAQLLKETEEHFYLFQCLKYKKCFICGKDGELHHVEQVGSNGYKSDYGQLVYTCLCREHHSEVHADYKKKHYNTGIRLNNWELDILKVKYPNHFKGEEK